MSQSDWFFMQLSEHQPCGNQRAPRDRHRKFAPAAASAACASRMWKKAAAAGRKCRGATVWFSSLIVVGFFCAAG